MNSGNSGSMQSSSGGDDEYDSRDDLISGFINPSSQPCPISTSQPPCSEQYNNHPSSIFHYPSVHLDPFKQSTPSSANTNSLLNFDLLSSRGLTSHPNYTAVVGQAGPSASTQQILGAPFQSPSLVVPLSAPENGELASSSSSQQTKVVRHSKKRSRASRRTPTTVLTTNTSNFRAMVQEFTGIPAPPLFSSKPFPDSSLSRSRFDLFNTASATRSNFSSQSLRGFPPHLKFPLTNVSSLAMKSQETLGNISSIQETGGFGMSHGNANANANYCEPPRLALLDKALPMKHNNTLSSSGGMELINAWDQVPLQSCHGKFGDSQMASNSTKMSYTTSSDFHAERGSENVSLRGEGIVDSWIYSSD
ncbi:hypothetical protein L1049_015790 [Liquidambar formosana]|uniref:VQ domain-containing protein n=1 Tax=Liquidambar formosana TaxID=63359 RepID=A0AAP0S594_LIQFO